MATVGDELNREVVVSKRSGFISRVFGDVVLQARVLDGTRNTISAKDSPTTLEDVKTDSYVE